MKRKIGVFVLFLLILIITLVLFLQTKKETTQVEIPQEQGTIAVFFCPDQFCEEQLLQKINNSTKTIHCAFYDLDLNQVITALEEKEKQGLDIKVVVDADNAEESQHLSFVKPT